MIVRHRVTPALLGCVLVVAARAAAAQTPPSAAPPLPASPPTTTAPTASPTAPATPAAPGTAATQPPTSTSMFSGATTTAQASDVAVPPKAAAVRFTFGAYLQRVGKGNLQLAAQRASLSVAEAQIAVARVFPDPEVTAGLYQYDVTRQGNPTASIAQIAVPLEIGGQRSARTAFAEANLSVAEADLADFLRNLRAQAANAYIDALHARLVLEQQATALASLEGLVSVNEQRLRAGDVDQATVLQSRVEANQFRAEVLDAAGNVQAADLGAIALLGDDARLAFGKPMAFEGDLRSASEHSYDVGALVAQARATRPDVVSSRRRLDAAARQIDLARANRVVGVGVGASWQHNFPVSGAQPLPASDFVGGTVTLPLPFSRLYHGELDAAYATHHQADALAHDIGIRVEVEVRQAIARYEAAAARVRLYTGGVLQDADAVLEKALYNYRRGGARLVEVLVAQRTDNAVHLSYFDALADAAHALVAVQQASGTWGLSF